MKSKTAKKSSSAKKSSVRKPSTRKDTPIPYSLPFGLEGAHTEGHVRLAPDWCSLGRRERLVVNKFIRRIAVGQELYGPLARGKKNWNRETFEEALDASCYIINAMLDKEGIQ